MSSEQQHSLQKSVDEDTLLHHFADGVPIFLEMHDDPAVARSQTESRPASKVTGEVSSSHPGLLALARLLGRSAARADLRRARRGAVPIMGMSDALLVVAAVIAGALVWSVIMRLR